MRFMLLKFTIVLLLSQFFTELQSQESKIVKHQRNLIILGYLDYELVGRDTIPVPDFIASGFLLDIEGVHHLVTAKHVIVQLDQKGNPTNNVKPESKSLYAFFYKKDGTVGWRSLREIQEKFQCHWIFHNNPLVDIAMLPYDIETSIDAVETYKLDSLIESKKMLELNPIFFVSFHPDLSSYQDLNPIFRSGIVSKINKDRTILLDAFAFPGNSGSPVFLTPALTEYYDDGGMSLGFSERHGLVGVVGEYIAYRDVAISKQTKHTRVVFEENSGIVKIWTSDFIKEIVNQENMVQQLNRIKLLKK